MTHKEVVKWLESLKKEIGKAENRTLWHYAESIDMAIEALRNCSEKPNGSDLISKQDVLNMIIVAGECEPDLGYTHLHKVVENIPSADRPIGWIPVSEKPKEEEKEYLVQLDGGGMCSCRWTNVNPIWTELTTDWHWNIFDIPQYCKVVAWMDLEPYREDGE